MLLEQSEYRHFTKPAELHKAINTLKGLVAGISSDGQLTESEISELIHWCDIHRVLSDRHPFSEIIPLIDDALIDGVITEDEALDIVWVCNNLMHDSDYYNAVTSGIQQLQGLLQGILADNYISDREIKNLQHWLFENEFLQTSYPYDEIFSMITGILSDGMITDEERNILMAYFSSFVDLRNSYNLNEKTLIDLRNTFNINGLCAVDPDIHFDSSVFCITGESKKASRNEMAGIIFDMGGEFKNNITKETKYLIVGADGSPCWAFACYGRKVEKALEMRKKGSSIMIVHENDFWDAVR
jgi:hypothetical protein